MNALTDGPIREALCARLVSEHARDPDFRLMPEFDVCGGRARIDIAALNGRFVGFEIKSHQDSTRRLEQQLNWYQLVFDEVVVVSAPRHIRAVRRLAPRWCGLWAAQHREGGVQIEEIRAARSNPRWRGAVAAGVLTMSELREIAERARVKVPSRTRHGDLASRLAKHLGPEELRAEVRRELVRRSVTR